MYWLRRYCVASCSGQAIFLVDEETEPGFGTVTFLTNFFRCRKQVKKGLRSDETDRKCATAKWYPAKTAKAFDHTNLLTIKVPSDMTMKARSLREHRKRENNARDSAEKAI